MTCRHPPLRGKNIGTPYTARRTSRASASLPAGQAMRKPPRSLGTASPRRRSASAPFGAEHRWKSHEATAIMMTASGQAPECAASTLIINSSRVSGPHKEEGRKIVSIRHGMKHTQLSPAQAGKLERADPCLRACGSRDAHNPNHHSGQSVCDVEHHLRARMNCTSSLSSASLGPALGGIATDPHTPEPPLRTFWIKWVSASVWPRYFLATSFQAGPTTA